MVDNKTVGERIKDRRKHRFMTVEECCNAIGVSVSAWRKYETGERMPRRQVQADIAKLFKCSVDSIFFKD